MKKKKTIVKKKESKKRKSDYWGTCFVSIWRAFLHFWVPLSLPSTLLLTPSERERTLQISSNSTIIYHQTFPYSNLLLPIHSFIHHTQQWVPIPSPIPLTISTNRSLSSCSASLYPNNRFLSFSLISYDLPHSSTITRLQLPLISSRFYFLSLYCIQFECAMWNCSWSRHVDIQMRFCFSLRPNFCWKIIFSFEISVFWYLICYYWVLLWYDGM
jgi:hypothetical protein